MRNSFVIAGALCLASVLLGCASWRHQAMTQETLADHIESLVGTVERSPNVVRFEVDGVAIAGISSAEHDRMRLVAVAAQASDVSVEQLVMLLTANYHTTLDARYALSQGVVYAAYLHPLSSLSPAELESAIRQVAALVRNFGGSYSSDELVFGALSTAPVAAGP